MQKCVNHVNLENAAKRIFTCKNWFRYSRERARQKIAKFLKIFAKFAEVARARLEGAQLTVAQGAASGEERGKLAPDFSDPDWRLTTVKFNDTYPAERRQQHLKTVETCFEEEGVGQNVSETSKCTECLAKVNGFRTGAYRDLIHVCVYRIKCADNNPMSGATPFREKMENALVRCLAQTNLDFKPDLPPIDLGLREEDYDTLDWWHRMTGKTK